MIWGKARRRPAKASGAQIGKRTVHLAACPDCLAGHEASGVVCECGGRSVSFDSRGEFRQWCVLRNAERAGLITELRRQVRMPLVAEGGVKVGALVLDFVYCEDGVVVYGDYKGGAATELASWKMKHFAAQYGCDVVIFGGR